jgi:hypothetical protein
MKLLTSVLSILVLSVVLSCLSCGPATPVINSFTANPGSIALGDFSTLQWNVSNAQKVSIDQGVGEVSLAGARVISPTSSTTYTLTAMNCRGTVTTTAVVMVSQPTPPPTPTPESEPGPAPEPTPTPPAAGGKYVWYVGYGSNLCGDRFFCYIRGGQYRFGGSYAQGCTDKTLPQGNKTIELPYRLYFARKSSSWSQGGVSFISVDKENDPNKWTLARMWKITEEQFVQVRQQEGASWYNNVVNLGMDEGIPVYTITNSMNQALNPPSRNYLLTIVIGLIESYQLNANEVYDYLYRKEGIQGYFSQQELKDIIEQGFNAGW